MIFKSVNGLILKIFNMLIFCSFILSQNLHFSLFSEGHKKPIYLTSIKEQSNTFFIVEQRGVIKIMVENIKHQKHCEKGETGENYLKISVFFRAIL